MKTLLEKSAIVVTSLLLGIFLVEGVLRVYFHLNRGSDFSLMDIRKEYRFQDYGALSGNSGCSWPDSLYPHPFLGYVQHDLAPCGWNLNSGEMFGNDFSNDPDDYQILFLGGSVAQQISSGFPHLPKSWIESALNAAFYPPRGKRFRVISGSVGGWKQPNQIYMIMKYMKHVDAFISLEGYNEVSMIQLQRKLDEPALPHFLTTSYPDAPSSYKTFSKIRRFLEATFLGKSYLAIMIYGNLKSWFVARAIQNLANSQVSRYFAYADSMSAQEKIEYGIRQYLSYLKSMDAVTFAGKKRGIIFFQPIPNLYKTLHPKDWPPRKGVGPELYLEVESQISKLELQSLRFQSLIRIYEKTNDFIYVDDIHAYVDPKTNHSLGYEIMARNISQQVGLLWKLKPRKQPPVSSAAPD